MGQNTPPAWHYTPTGRVRARLGRLPGWTRAVALVVAALLGLGLVSYLRYGWKPSSSQPDASYYTGTEAENWPEAADIVLPVALAQEHFTAGEIRAILDDLEDLIVLGRVDWATGKSDPAAYVRAHSPGMRQYLGDTLDGAERLALVSALADGHELLEEVRYTYAEPPTVDEVKDDEGVTVLEITVKARFAYYFDRRGQRYYNPLVVLDTTTVWQLPVAGEVDPSATGLWLTDYEWALANGDCEEALAGHIAPAHVGSKEAVLDDEGGLTACK
ncbi:hypothetical protein Afil01_12210 [Actinorhabdospora filicis]|uniref:Uncharacterized protein n=1 Tax=Actinorhabdospora filicis TaxID=1785913 RepID=A0A9W6W7C2_9ACTN|nr:hypothetical protein Afil01_12210 [Actinorhabdospora filicis]